MLLLCTAALYFMLKLGDARLVSEVQGLNERATGDFGSFSFTRANEKDPVMAGQDSHTGLPAVLPVAALSQVHSGSGEAYFRVVRDPSRLDVPVKGGFYRMEGGRDWEHEARNLLFAARSSQ